jgi:esterase/lipase superfamily enzyme/tetratricopeptide (TPR) repeat protein
VRMRQPWGAAGFSLLAALLIVLLCDVASAQSRWPPWQSYGEAERVAQEKRKRQQAAIPQQSEIDALNALVAKLRQAGKTDAAIAVAKRALALTERRYGRDHVATAAALTTLAELLIETKRYADAEPLLKRALAISEKGKDNKATAQALHKLGKLYERQGRKKEAHQYLDRSRALGGGAPGVSVARTRDEDIKREGGSGEQKQAQPKTDTGRGREIERLREEAQRRVAEEREKMARAQDEAEKAQAMAKKSMEESEAGRGGGGAHPRKAKPRAYYKAPPAGAGEGQAAAPSAPPAPSPSAPKPDMLSRKSGGGGPGAEPPTMAAPPPGTLRTIAPSAPADGEKSVEQPRAMARDVAPHPSPDAAAPDLGVAAKDDKWDVVPVFFGTDRAEEANPKRLSYGSDRGHRLELGRALVTVPKAHEVPQIERPWALRIPYFNVTIYEEAEDPNKHFTLQEIKKLSKEDLLKLVRQRLAGSKRFKDQALVFVHGYNTSFDNAVYRTAQIAYDLKFDGAPFLYSWPSGGAVASYTYDRESAEASKPYMRKFLEMVVKETGAKAVSIIAHSMGNQPLLDVLKDMKSSAPEGVVISQVILAAPDVDSDSFANLAASINGLAKGVTLYAASNDRALIVSRNFWGHTRAGDVPAGGPLVLPGIDTIDVTAASTDVFALNHSEYAQNTKVLEDIGELIATGKRPPGQRLMAPERVNTEHGDYWRYHMATGSP